LPDTRVPVPVAPKPPEPPRPPRFVSFEGIDGAGKSTLLHSLRSELEAAGEHVVFTREETDTFLGDTVRKAVSDGKEPMAILYLFLADRAQHLKELQEDFDRGALVITDRYHDSTRAYQSVALKDRFDTDTFEAWLHATTKDWLIPPRRTYLLDIDPLTSLARLHTRSEQGGYEKHAFLEKVRARYLQLAAAEPERWVVLDATQPSERLLKQVLEDLRSIGLIGAAAPAKNPRR
jgi:dTMP kinase